MSKIMLEKYSEIRRVRFEKESFKDKTKLISVLKETKEKLVEFHSSHPEIKLVYFCDDAINKAIENYKEG